MALTLEPKAQIEIFHKKIQTKALDADIKYILCRDLLKDIEQNLMRSTLRDKTNEEPVQYTLFFDTDEMFELCESIEFRFGCVGANVTMNPTPQAIVAEKIKTRKPPKGKKQTNAQKILDYLNKLPNGTTFKISDMLESIEITNDQLKDTKKMNKAIADKLKSMQTNKKGYYCKP